MPQEPFQTSRARTELAVRGMSCNNCARHVSEALQSVPGVAGASVDLDQGRASIQWLGQPDTQTALQRVKKAGYDAEVVEPAHDHECHDSSDDRQARWHAALWVGVVGALPLMLGEWVFGWALEPWFQWLSFGLASCVQFFAGARFYRGAWNQLKAGQSNMDTLVSLGSTTAYVYSVWALFSGVTGHLFFMEAASIITFVSIGHWVESRVSRQASDALRALLHLAPPLARRRELDGSEREVPVAELRPGDLVALRPGDRVATDGEVVEGGSVVDESMLTGESLPVEKSPGQPVYAGTLNVNGQLLVRVTGTGESTALAHIIAAVQRAQNSRANIQRLGDSVSSVFVPIVVAVAVAAGLWWGLAPESARLVHHWLASYLWATHPPASALAAAIMATAAVLIVACPCAMGLATPAAIMAASNAAARRGILIRDGVALEKAGEITAVALDKTGTLTMGQHQFASIHVLAAENGQAAELAASLARHSSHPLSRAVGSQFAGNISLSEWRELPGKGVEGKFQDKGGALRQARLGSYRWLADMGVDLASGQAFAKEWSAQGASVLGLAVEKNLAAMVALKDVLKPDAKEVVAQLRNQGLKVYLVTGDNSATAATIAQEAGIAAENVFAEVRPELKAGLVKKLQAQGERVAFVGDGINDAPALEQANLGIAVSRASDVAREAADIILLNSELSAVPESLGLAKAALRTIKQNLFWAFFYNAMGIPLAALGFLSPVLCAAAMGFSDVVVIGNALRLRNWSAGGGSCRHPKARDGFPLPARNERGEG